MAAIFQTFSYALNLVAKDPVSNIPSFILIIAWHRPGDEPLSEPMMVYWYTYASLGLGELKFD